MGLIWLIVRGIFEYQVYLVCVPKLILVVMMLASQSDLNYTLFERQKSNVCMQ